MNAVTDEVAGPVLFGYDGSDPARAAIATAGRVLGGCGRESVVVTVWESVGSAILRNLPPDATEIGRVALLGGDLERLRAQAASFMRTAASGLSASAVGAPTAVSSARMVVKPELVMPNRGSLREPT